MLRLFLCVRWLVVNGITDGCGGAVCGSIPVAGLGDSALKASGKVSTSGRSRRKFPFGLSIVAHELLKRYEDGAASVQGVEGEAGMDGSRGAPFTEAKEDGRTRRFRRLAFFAPLVSNERPGLVGLSSDEGKLSRGGRINSTALSRSSLNVGCLKIKMSRRALVGNKRTDVTSCNFC